MWSSLTLPQLPFKRQPLLLSRAPQAFMCNCSRSVSRDHLLWTRQRSASKLENYSFLFYLHVQEYKERRDFVCNMLIQAGFSNFLKPQGSFFVFAQLPDKCPLNDVSKHSDPSILDLFLEGQLYFWRCGYHVYGVDGQMVIKQSYEFILFLSSFSKSSTTVWWVCGLQ